MSSTDRAVPPGRVTPVLFGSFDRAGGMRGRTGTFIHRRRRRRHYTQGVQPQATVEAPGVAGAVQTFSGDGTSGGLVDALPVEPLDALVKDALEDSPTVRVRQGGAAVGAGELLR